MFKVGEPEMCPCRHHDNRTSTAACQAHDTLRQDMCPEPTLQRDKVCCDIEEDSRFHEGERHLHRTYDNDEEEETFVVLE